MRILIQSSLLAMATIFTVLVGAGHAIDIYYDFEGDTATATDKLTGDGAQDGTLIGLVSTQTEPPGNVPWGTQSGLFEGIGKTPFSSIEVPGSTVLGETFTMAMHFNNNLVNPDLARLFSSFGGLGGITADRILFDYDPSMGVLSNGIRAYVGGVRIDPTNAVTAVADPGYHHVALTAEAVPFSDSTVKIYFDGVEVASATVAPGYSNNGATLRVGEDVNDVNGAWPWDVLTGNVDDVVVLDQALSATDIALLAASNSAQSVVTPTGGYAVNYSFEGDSGTTITDKWTGDGTQDGITYRDAGVDTNPANALEGTQSGYLAGEDPGKFSKINAGVLGDLGTEFTLSAVVNVDGDGYASGKLARLFSSYAGSSSAAGRMILDFEPDGHSGFGTIRFILPDGTNVNVESAFSYGEDHTLTATYDDGAVTLYIDGVEVTTGTSSGGAIDLGEYELHIGEDLGGSLNENLVGDVDDVLILGRALTLAEVAQLHAEGVAAVIELPGPGGIPGDANNDGSVDETDAQALATNWGANTDVTWAMGDFDGDGAVGPADASIMAANWGYGPGESTTAVPEPTTLALLLTISLALFVRRRR